jgi:hypothetical protein
MSRSCSVEQKNKNNDKQEDISEKKPEQE